MFFTKQRLSYEKSTLKPFNCLRSFASNKKKKSNNSIFCIFSIKILLLKYKLLIYIALLRFPIKKADTDYENLSYKLPVKENLNQTVSIALIKWTN
jgi:hypothetical protein